MIRLRSSRQVRITRLLLLGVSLWLLAGCSNGMQPKEAERPVGAGSPNPDYVITVSLAPSDTVLTVEEATGGTVVAWQQGDYAIVGFAGTPGDGTTGFGDVESNDARFEAGGIAQMNGRSQVWAGGRSQVWVGGRSQVWVGGRSQVWVGGSAPLWEDGSFQWMPANTPIWQQIRLEEGHALASNLGYGVKVAVIDTGMDLQHPALVDALAPADEWWDFYADDPLPLDEGELGVGGAGHGTSVAGIVRQVAPRATILPLRVLGPDGSGNIADVAAAISWAVEKGARIINLSLGSDEPSPAVEAALRGAARRGVLVVASTGNTGDTAVTYPAATATDEATGWQRLSVTSVDASDAKSGFATYGSSVELAAPGEEVHGPAPDNQAASWSGTSMAAPMASGALALAIGENVKGPRANLADVLRQRAFDGIYADGLNSEYMDLLGTGRLDIYEFLRNVMVQRGGPNHDDGPGRGHGPGGPGGGPGNPGGGPGGPGGPAGGPGGPGGPGGGPGGR